MRPIYRNYLYAIFLFAIVSLQCNTKKEDDRRTGLILESDKEYLAIDYADLTGASDLPPAVDLSPDMPEVGHQGNQMSCVAWVTAYALKSFEEKDERKITLNFSPSFVYNQINNGEDKGSQFEDALRVLTNQGAALMNDMPYDPDNYRKQPTEEIRLRAKPFRIRQWLRVNTAERSEIKLHIKNRIPVIIGAPVDEGFRNAIKNGTGEYFWNTKSGNSLGDHAMLVVGYDDVKKAFKIMNSWGKTWGNDGYCWMDYDFFEKIVKRGYIARDYIETNPDKPIDNTVTDNTPIDNTHVVDNNPTKIKTIKFDNIQVLHSQNHPTYGNCMKITGIADIPKGTGKTFQISTHFYLSNSTIQVGSLQSPQFADVNGYAATGTILYSIPEDGLNNWPFEIYMPYTAFNLTTGSYDANGKYQYTRTYLYAIPTLFIDNFSYAKGEAINFYVDK